MISEKIKGASAAGKYEKPPCKKFKYSGKPQLRTPEWLLSDWISEILK
jgi:hypothetical protein